MQQKPNTRKKIIKVASIYCEDIPDAREEIADALERAAEVTA